MGRKEEGKKKKKKKERLESWNERLKKKKALQFNFRFLLESHFSDSLESLFDIDVFFGWGFEIWDISFRLAPSQGTFLENLIRINKKKLFVNHNIKRRERRERKLYI